MSSVSTLGKPAFFATHTAPATPPAGPDISRFTGALRLFSALISPPSDRSRFSLAVVPQSFRAASRLPT